MRKLYRLFNLVVSSSIDFPETVVLDENLEADVTIDFIDFDVKELLPVEYTLDKYFMFPITRNHIVLSCRAGVFQILNGNTINVMARKEITEAEIRIFLLGSSMGAIQIQRGYIPLHGGAIVSSGKAVIISGQAGAGKSTMTSALTSLGYQYLTDDVSSVIFSEEKPVILPSYPQRKLIRDACILLNYEPNQLPIADKGRDKFAIRDKELWCDKPVGLDLLVVLVPNHQNEEVQVTEIVGSNKLSVVIQSLYRKNMHYVDGKIPPSDLKKILEITSHIRVMYISIPRSANRILDYAREVASIIEKYINYKELQKEEGLSG